MLVTLAAVVMMPSRSSAQTTTADIVGTVTDAGGAVIPGADVTVTNKGTGDVRKVKAGGNGDFVVSLLPPGSYSLTVTMASFKKFEVPNLTLAAGDKPRINAQLAVGDTTQTISVEATTPLLQSESATLQSSVNQLAVQDMPLNGRNFVQLVQMVPGANEGPPNSLTNGAKPDDRRQSAAISVNGQSDVLNNNMIDGMDNNERLIGSLGVRPSVDAISELRVQSNVYSADVGRTGGAVINIVTKSGTNSFHGTLYEYFRNDIFNTYPYQFGLHNPKQRWRQNQYGGSLGGPIIRNKTFFFGDYEGFRQVAWGVPTTAFGPTTYELAHPGDFTDQLAASCGAGTVLTPAQIDSVGLTYFNMYPTPNAGNTAATATGCAQGKYLGNSKNFQNSRVLDGRIDHQFNANNSIFARYSYNNVYSGVPGVLPNVTAKLGTSSTATTFDPNSGGGFAPDIGQQAILSYIHTFSPSLLLTLQAGYLRVDNENYPVAFGSGNKVGPNLAQMMGQQNINVSDQTSGMGRITPSGYQALGGNVFSPLVDFSQGYQYQGTVSYTRGAHTLKFGAQLIRRQATSLQSASANPQWSFPSLVTMLQGTGYTNVNRSVSLANPHYRWWETGAYVQDDYHVLSNLTLNLGLRYDVFTNKTAVNNQISNWDYAAQQLIVAGTSGVSPTTNLSTSWGLLAPRIGFAYTVRQGLVVRGGFGLSYYPTDITSNPSLKNAPFLSAYGPFNYSQMSTDPTNKAFSKLAAGSPPASVVSATNPSGPQRGVALAFRPATAIQYNVSVQKDFHGNVLTVAGVGIEGRHIPQAFLDVNAPAPGVYTTTNPAQSHRPTFAKYAGVTTVAMYASQGVSHYYGGTVSFERRLSNGLSYSVNYTHSRLLDNALGMSNQGNEGYGLNYNKFGDRYEYGNSDLDLRNRLAATGNYKLPFFKDSSGVKKVLLANWSTNMLLGWSAGQPVTITESADVSGQGSGTQNTNRPNMIGKPMLDGSQRTLNQYFNTASFVAQTAGTIGTAPRNPTYGPHYRHVDFSLIKTFPIHESTNLEFRAEGYNITNTANFATPNASLGPATFGKITAMSGIYTPRVLQFALKLGF
jgi:outer membrane receptor protein involved in Fe transport